MDPSTVLRGGSASPSLLARSPGESVNPPVDQPSLPTSPRRHGFVRSAAMSDFDDFGDGDGWMPDSPTLPLVEYCVPGLGQQEGGGSTYNSSVLLRLLDVAAEYGGEKEVREAAAYMQANVEDAAKCAELLYAQVEPTLRCIRTVFWLRLSLQCSPSCASLRDFSPVSQCLRASAVDRMATHPRKHGQNSRDTVAVNLSLLARMHLLKTLPLTALPHCFSLPSRSPILHSTGNGQGSRQGIVPEVDSASASPSLRGQRATHRPKGRVDGALDGTPRRTPASRVFPCSRH
jgi:hypothetical protein